MKGREDEEELNAFPLLLSEIGLYAMHLLYVDNRNVVHLMERLERTKSRYCSSEKRGAFRN